MKTIGTLFGRTVFYNNSNCWFEGQTRMDITTFFRKTYQDHRAEIEEAGTTIEPVFMPLPDGKLEEYLVVNNQGYLRHIAKSMQVAQILSCLLFLTDDGCDRGQECLYLYTNIGANPEKPVFRASTGYKLIGNTSEEHVALQHESGSFREVNASLVIGIQKWEISIDE